MATYTYKTLAQTHLLGPDPYGIIYSAPASTQAIINQVYVSTRLAGRVLDFYIVSTADVKGTITQWGASAITYIGRFEDAGGNAVSVGPGGTNANVKVGSLIEFPYSRGQVAMIEELDADTTAADGVHTYSQCEALESIIDNNIGNIYSESTPIASGIALTQYAVLEIIGDGCAITKPIIISAGYSLYVCDAWLVADPIINFTVTGVEIT